ncbi:MAG: bifunctional 5,10-methylenetetrahydrofolate dehydrogenase/5,10-methenyltetrahydrofolate cyclohydrolase [Bacilli bacterium]|nr:bifunctional 5,10-methylenetetrahydrofolate dehydrogenase/5,10-methenyltetrahydrofolate cyclohydrolase [Bacilli bacterium]
MNKLIDGKKISLEIKEELKNEVKNFSSKPVLVVIQIGEDPASDVYIKNKKNVAKYIGIDCLHIKYDDTVDEKTIVKKITELNIDDSINGIIVQLPLPKHLNESKIINTIKCNKDVDGLTSKNIGLLANNLDGMISCTPLGIMTLLKKYNIEIAKKKVVIVGRSNLVGKPLINLFLNKDATVTVCHSKTINLETHTKNADILVVAVGKKHLINSSMVKENAIVIDVGINRINDKLVGDVDFDKVYSKVSLITPVPGGVGPMTVVMLMKNTISSYKLMNTNK